MQPVSDIRHISVKHEIKMAFLRRTNWTADHAGTHKQKRRHKRRRFAI
ncbi:hypothetical protein CEV33_4333 [Brucella grignonensis]|uniref:Uncharacterized protein n=1 Tax=Brucella grignonensis TaxID=94627 RepID=A0A256FN84_9HYPH|nr:hypothetical protein CEV33_4333 [Brucella grignonensis]